VTVVVTVVVFIPRHPRSLLSGGGGGDGDVVTVTVKSPPVVTVKSVFIPRHPRSLLSGDGGGDGEVGGDGDVAGGGDYPANLSMAAARAKSSWVRPPASCVVRSTCTVL